MATLSCKLPSIVHDSLDYNFLVSATSIVIMHIDELWRNLVNNIILRLSMPILAYIDSSTGNELSFNLSLSPSTFSILPRVASPTGTVMGWPIETAVIPRDTEPLLLAIGAEGGWTDAEVALFDSLEFTRFSAGDRILRTDTACAGLLALVHYLRSL